MRRSITTGTALLAAALAAAAAGVVAAEGDIEAGPRYLLLATRRTGTLQAELDRAAAQGYRVLVGSAAPGREIMLVLERATQPPDTYTYRLLAAMRTSTMERELNRAAAEGFRLLPQAAMSGGVRGRELLVVMERTPRAGRRYEYVVLAASRASTLQRKVSEAVAARFVPVCLITSDEHVAVMERERGSTHP